MHQTQKATFSVSGIADSKNINEHDLTYDQIMKYVNDPKLSGLIKIISKRSHEVSSVFYDGAIFSLELKPIKKESFKYTVYYKCGNGRYKVEFYKKYKINGRHCHIGWSDTESGAIQMCKKYNDLYSEILKNPSK
jgi:hypothetical protein